MWSGSLSSCHHVTIPKPDWLIFCHMAGWLANCSWQAVWLTECLSNKMSTSPSPQAETACGHVCDDLDHIDQMYYPPVETSHGQVWYYCKQAVLQSDIHPTHPHMRLQARFAFGQMSSQVNWTSYQMYPPTDKNHLDMERWLTPHGRFLHHERPFTREGNYLVDHVVHCLMPYTCKGWLLIPGHRSEAVWLYTVVHESVMQAGVITQSVSICLRQLVEEFEE